MIKYNFFSESKEEVRNFVNECEEKFKNSIDNTVEKIISSNKKIITLSGPSCSGKTTTAMRFTEFLTKKGYRVGVISIDDFFKDHNKLVEMANEFFGGVMDYDSVNAIELDELKRVSHDIRHNHKTVLPIFNFNSQNKDGYRDFDPNEYDFFIFEGIQAIYPQVTELFKGESVSVYISVVDDVCVNGVEFSSREIRFLRRVARDSKFRNSPPHKVFEMWSGVCTNEDSSILPFSGYADIKIDSFMKYEPFMVKEDTEPLLEMISSDDVYYETAQNLLCRLKKLNLIGETFLPEESVLHEFLG